MAKNIKKKVNKKEFEEILEEGYILKTTKNTKKVNAGKSWSNMKVS